MKELKGRALLHRTGSIALFADTSVLICGCGVGTEAAKTVYVVQKVLRRELTEVKGRTRSYTTDEEVGTLDDVALAVEVYKNLGGVL